MGIRWPEWGSAPPRTPLISTNAHQGYLIEEAGKYKVIRCDSCILNHVVPLPESVFLDQYYQREFYQKSHPDYLRRYEEDAEWWEMNHRHTLDQAALILHDQTSSQSIRRKPAMLDVGTGPGLMLSVAHNKGWVAAGVEPNPHVAGYVRQSGRDVFNGTLAQFHAVYSDDRFDLIHCYEVLEHIPEPETFILQCWDLLAEDGLLVVVVPNDYNDLQLAACKQFDLPHWWVSIPDHLNYFTPKMLQLLVRRCGFNIVDIRGTYPMEQFLLSGRNYIGNDTLGRQCHHERVAWELAMDRAGLWPLVEVQYRQNLGDGYGPTMGREIYLVARKRV